MVEIKLLAAAGLLRAFLCISIFAHWKSASDACKKLTPSTETKASVTHAVENVKEYGRKLIPNEATKQKVSRFYESQVAKLKYTQLKDGFHPGDRNEDCSRLTDDDSFYGTSEVQRRNFDDQEVPSSNSALGPIARLRTSSLGGRTTGNQEWKGSFMQFKDTGRRAL